MESSTEQRVAIKFCFNAGNTATETVETVRAANGDETLNGSNIFRWYERLREGREEVQDNPNSGGPFESRTEGNMDSAWKRMYSRKLLMMGREDARNMQSFITE